MPLAATADRWALRFACLPGLSLSACGHSLQGIPLSLARPSPSSHAPSPALQVIAFDRSHNKASEVRRLAEGFGLTCVKAYKMDATKAVLTPEQQAAAAAAAGATRGAGGAEGQQASSSGNGAAAAGDTNAAAGAAKGVADGSRGRRGGLSQPPGEATLRRLERIAASRRARGLEPAPSAHTAAGKEAVIQGFPPEALTTCCAMRHALPWACDPGACVPG